MNVDTSTIMYIAIGIGAFVTLAIGVTAIGLTAWFFLRPAPRRPSALASIGKSSRSELDDDTQAVVEIYTSYKKAKNLDAVRGDMAEAAKKA